MMLTAVIVMLCWMAGIWLLFRIPVAREGEGKVDLERVSVIVPARDEERNLPRLLASLGKEGERPGEILVVDDGSSDDTAGVARRMGATVIPLEGKPAGWSGKTFACWTGARQARGRVLVFLDADTWLEPGGLARLVGDRQRRGGVLSVEPFHAVRSSHEQLSSIFNIIRMAGVGAFTPLAGRRGAGQAFGPCLVVEREAYLASGGHAHPEVRGLVLENVALGRVFSRAGLHVHCAGGRGSVSFRMYPDGPAQLAGGWARAVALGAGSTSPLLLGLVIAWISGANLTLIELFTAAVAGSPGPLLAAAVMYLAYSMQVRWMLVRIGSFSWHTALLFPLHVVFMNLVFAWSALAVLFRRRVRWKGRQVPVGGLPR